MNPLPVIAIFDIGKTNKKLFLFDESYRIVFEKSTQFTESLDEDGFPCENLGTLQSFVLDSLREIFSLQKYKIVAVNFSAYGASFVHLDKNGKPLTDLYNYLKPYTPYLTERFYTAYGNPESFSLQTASPVLGSLNSGLQLYRMKYEKPEVFKNLFYSLHLPQYLSFLITGKYYSELTSIGCHTALWDFGKHDYHAWVMNEKLNVFLAPIENGRKTFSSVMAQYPCKVGTGLHDSSAALIPYLVNFSMPFVLISTGTWCISMNPFNKTALTAEELNNDCLCYLQYTGEPVKASRLHAGLEHELQVKRIAEHFNQDILKYKDIPFDPDFIYTFESDSPVSLSLTDGFAFHKRNLADFKTDIEAYHQLIADLVSLQILSTRLVMKGSTVKRIFVDGGFSHNSIFMHLLANGFPETEVFAASMAQASALGAALSIHSEWNSRPVPADLIELRYYSSGRTEIK
ncbi:MAG TPA: FGGY family carbohydrate kinase [Puia sp.]|nr:FGGY family carbohydrate kinase [Puia sp.]